MFAHYRPLLLIAMCLSSFALAASATAGESKIWFAQGSSLSIVNLGGEPATVSVRSFSNQGRVIPSSSTSFTIAPGQSAGASPAGAAYVLVVATRPVVVTATTQAYMQPEGSAGGQLFPRYSYFLPGIVHSIDCTGAPPPHFACNQRAPGNFDFNPPIDVAPGTFRPTPN